MSDLATPYCYGSFPDLICRKAAYLAGGTHDVTTSSFTKSIILRASLFSLNWVRSLTLPTLFDHRPIFITTITRSPPDHWHLRHLCKVPLDRPALTHRDKTIIKKHLRLLSSFRDSLIIPRFSHHSAILSSFRDSLIIPRSSFPKLPLLSSLLPCLPTTHPHHGQKIPLQSTNRLFFGPIHQHHSPASTSTQRQSAPVKTNRTRLPPHIGKPPLILPRAGLDCWMLIRGVKALLYGRGLV
ncbi:hypothetical protein GE09DRAFT_108043 [Coniochaeta sp. 2T2.1]|nr:hypothetical protein GE09DRAFT_108043 [Coniochaeta sp. 2T2.1]